MIERWWRQEAAGPALEAAGLATVPGAMAACAAGEVLSRDRQSAAVRLPGPPPLFVKWRRPRHAKAWKALLRPSRERREAAGALAARARGIPAPVPMAVGERWRGPWLVGSVLIRPFHVHLEPADVVLARPEAGPLRGAVVEALRAWHDAGYRHGDCYPKNVLLDARGATIAPIGAPKARFVRPGSRLDARRVRDLAQWLAGWQALGLEDDMLARYAAAPGLPALATLRAAVERRLAIVLARKRASAASRPAREPAGPPPPVPLPAEAPSARRIQRPIAALGPRG